jgi:hypothetical protein
VLAPLEALKQRAVAAREPPDSQTWQPVRLRHHVQRHGRRREVRGLGQRPRGVELEPPVDLVAEQADAALLAELDKPCERLHVRQRPGWVVGEVDGDQPGRGAQQALEGIEVEFPVARSTKPSTSTPVATVMDSIDW